MRAARDQGWAESDPLVGWRMLHNPATTIVCTPYLTDAECDTLVGALDETQWSCGLIGVPAAAGAGEEATIRACDVNHSVPADVLERVSRDVSALNQGLFRFDLTGYHERDPVSVMRYRPGGHFDWHIDNGVAAPPLASRKLSVVIQLSDPDTYAGGDLEFGRHVLPGYGKDGSAAQLAAMRQRGALDRVPELRTAPCTAPDPGSTPFAGGLAARSGVPLNERRQAARDSATSTSPAALTMAFQPIS